MKRVTDFHKKAAQGYTPERLFISWRFSGFLSDVVTFHKIVRSAILFKELLPAQSSQADQARAEKQHGAWLRI